MLLRADNGLHLVEHFEGLHARLYLPDFHELRVADRGQRTEDRLTKVKEGLSRP